MVFSGTSIWSHD